MTPRLITALLLSSLLISCAGSGSSTSNSLHYSVPQDDMIANVVDIVEGMGLEIESADYTRGGEYVIQAYQRIEESGRFGRSTRRAQLRIHVVDAGNETTRLNVVELSQRANYGSQHGPQLRSAFLRLLRQEDYPQVARN